jgi:uncharacterized protein YcaQ
MHRLTIEQARRVAVRAQLLEAARPPDLVSMVERLTMLQIDPTAAVAPTADLVSWSRLGGSYRPEHLTHALEVDRSLVEFDAIVRPMRDLGLYLADAPQRPAHERSRTWLAANDRFRRDVLDRLRGEGPLASRDIPDTSTVPWPSSGWSNNRNVTRMLEMLLVRGETAVTRRIGRERVWDLPERVYPPDLVIPTTAEAERLRDKRRLGSLGIARARARAMPVERVDVGQAGEPARVDGVRGEWRVDPAALGEAFAGRTALLSPFDRLVHDRVRTEQLFGFEYVLEMYKPAAKRRWGYFALPILHEDRLIGKLDAIADRKAGLLRINAVHEDMPIDGGMRRAVDAEIDTLATWLGLGVSRS